MPFLIPVSLQLLLGYSPLHAGLMMLPAALAGMAIKRAATPLIRHYGYRNTLVANTVLLGLVMAAIFSASVWFSFCGCFEDAPPEQG